MTCTILLGSKMGEVQYGAPKRLEHTVALFSGARGAASRRIAFDRARRKK